MSLLKKSGAGGRLKYDSVVMRITKWTSKPKKNMAKATDSSNDDGTQKILFPSQIAKSFEMEVTAEGIYHDSGAGTQVALLADLLDGTATAAAVDLDVDDAVPFGYGYFDVSEMEFG